MEKRQLIEAVRRLNPTATVAFLSQFDAPALRQYLHRLEDTHRRQPQIKAWVRRRSEELRMVS